ncbi:RNA-binding protein NOB1 [Marchantia polymorpha subsp. ruderalis]
MATVTPDVGVGGGGWAAIARKDAAVEKKLDIPALLSTEGLKTVVVDANAIIGGGSKLSGIADQFFTIKEVLQEVRDPASRFYLATLPVTINCLEPSEEALAKVVRFARATGDLQALSEVDMKLIALTYTLEAQVHGTEHIRTQPPPLILTRKTNGPGLKDPPGWGSVPNPEEWEGIDDEEDGANTGSRIMGLKTLSLDAPESIVTGDHGLSGADSEKDLVGDSAAVHDSKSTGDPISEGEESAAVHDAERNGDGVEDGHISAPRPVREDDETPYSATNAESAQTLSQSVQEADSSKSLDIAAVPSISVEEKSAAKAQVDEGGDDWQRALSRSTRRQYLKREQRRAARLKWAEEQAANNVQDTGMREGEGEQAAEESLVQAAEGAVLFRPSSADVDCGEEEAQLVHGSLEHGSEGLDGAESVDDHSGQDDAASNIDAASSAVDTEQSWDVGPLWTSSIACMTGDYAMQNVILQMGLRLLSTSGQHIKELNKWILKCQACGKVTHETGRLFCPKCGNGGTLFKVSITVGPNGTVHAGRSRRPILRGTRYSLPLPKGGREGALKNPILREDQLPAKPRKAKKPEFEAFSSSDVVFSLSHERKGEKGAAVKSAAAIFSGRRNPNERRKIAK